MRDAPVLPAMPQPDIEIFRASIMIAGSFGRYSVQTARDHETARHETGHSCTAASMIRRRAGLTVAGSARSFLGGGTAGRVVRGVFTGEGDDH
jgi:hypothetical protein